MTRPTGVTVLGILGIVTGAFTLALGLLFLLGSAFMAQWLHGLPLFLAGLATVGGIFLLIFGAFDLVVSIGLLNLANWARIIVMVFAVIGLVFAALGMLGAMAHMFPVLLMRRAFRGAVDALILWYLSQPHVKRAFSGEIPTSPAAPPAAIPPAASV